MTQTSSSATPLADTDLEERWERKLSAVYCAECGSSLLVPLVDEKLCPVCYKGKLLLQSTPPFSQPPELLLPYKLSESQVLTQLTNWCQGVWLRPTEFNAETLTSRLTRVMLPVWLVDGTVRGIWQAQSGYTYEVASSTEAYTSGGWSTRKEVETRLRWEPRTGTLDRTYQNLAVPALQEHNRLISGLGKFSYPDAKLYSPGNIETAIVRLPNQSTDQALPLGKEQLDAAAKKDCQEATEAQQIEQFKLEATYTNLNWTLLLLPAYSTYYRDEQGVTHLVWMNGQSGRLFGRRSASQSKGWQWTGALAGVGLAVIILAILISLAANVFPPASLISTILIILGAIGILASPAPAIWAWQFNRNNDEDS